MADKFMGKYRIPSARAVWWDYSWEAAYFITICAAHRTHYFGEIDNGSMILSDIGRIAETEWVKTPDIRPDMNITLDAYVVMPNHFHAILIIGRNPFNTPHRRDALHASVDENALYASVDDNMNNGNACNAYFNRDACNASLRVQRKNLASVVRGFKSAVTRQAQKIDPEFGWQERYWDRIIRNDEEYGRIKTYIENNPVLWTRDQLNGAASA
jgi:putative transposase